jgi:hypothetical protein
LPLGVVEQTVGVVTGTGTVVGATYGEVAVGGETVASVGGGTDAAAVVVVTPTAFRDVFVATLDVLANVGAAVGESRAVPGSS